VRPAVARFSGVKRVALRLATGSWLLTRMSATVADRPVNRLSRVCLRTKRASLPALHRMLLPLCGLAVENQRQRRGEAQGTWPSEAWLVGSLASWATLHPTLLLAKCDGHLLARYYLPDGRAPGGHEGWAPVTLKLSKATMSSSPPKRFSPSETACSLMTAGPSTREDAPFTQPAPCQ